METCIAAIIWAIDGSNRPVGAQRYIEITFKQKWLLKWSLIVFEWVILGLGTWHWWIILKGEEKVHWTRHEVESRVAKCNSPFMAFVKRQTLLTGFPNWDVSRVWSETTKTIGALVRVLLRMHWMQTSYIQVKLVCIQCILNNTRTRAPIVLVP